ncbi:NAD-dependent epimerase/dehydratase family protein, partial [bacterium]
LGLLHHGSGPPGTSLVDDGFVEGFVAHAEAVARRYPWAEWYTPINEPLTTARFSALYGLWYPHARDDRLFARALLNQCRATVLAMRAIRRINPSAKLAQTEDLGRVHGTMKLQYQVDLENDRRWLTWDLLNGRIDRSAPAIRFLLRSGVGPSELSWFVDNPCAPDLIGLNHYVTSDRWLDHRIERYPDLLPGGNGRDRYVDTEAVRVMPDTTDGWQRALSEAWRRYRQPIAITEVHLGCSRDEQLRWLGEAWSAAADARASGADIRAVTAWALLGSRDWNSLLTRWDDHYEPGAFDVRGSERRPTALAEALRALGRGNRRIEHPVMEGTGWWRRSMRLTYGSQRTRGQVASSAQRPVLITGAGGNLGHAIALTCELRGLEYQLCTREHFDICSPGDVQAALERYRPWAVINAAGYVRVDDAEREDARCYRENAIGPAR